MGTDKILENLEKIKDEITEANLTTGPDDHFADLVKLKNVEDELYETLILIHSSHKSEIQAIKSNHLRTLHKLVDNNVKIYTLISDITKQLETLNAESLAVQANHMKEQTGQNVQNTNNAGIVKTILLNPKNLIIVLWGIGFFFVMLWAMFVVNDAAGEKLLHFLKEVFTLYKGTTNV